MVPEMYCTTVYFFISYTYFPFIITWSLIFSKEITPCNINNKYFKVFVFTLRLQLHVKLLLLQWGCALFFHHFKTIAAPISKQYSLSFNYIEFPLHALQTFFTTKCIYTKFSIRKKFDGNVYKKLHVKL